MKIVFTILLSTISLLAFSQMPLRIIDLKAEVVHDNIEVILVVDNVRDVERVALEVGLPFQDALYLTPENCDNIQYLKFIVEDKDQSVVRVRVENMDQSVDYSEIVGIESERHVGYRVVTGGIEVYDKSVVAIRYCGGQLQSGEKEFLELEPGYWFILHDGLVDKVFVER